MPDLNIIPIVNSQPGSRTHKASVLDWSPWPRPGDLALTLDELAALRRVKKACQSARSGEPIELSRMADDILSLCETVKKASRLRPDEYEFPKYAALVNNIAGVAYQMRYDGKVAAENVIELCVEPSQCIFDRTTQSEVCNALLFVRPYIGLVEPRTQEALERLRSMRLTVEVDGENVVNDVMASEFLIGLDGHGLRTRLFSFVTLKTTCLFQAVAYDDGQAFNDQKLGIFLPNATRILMYVSPEPSVPPMKIRAGAVLGRYIV